MPKRGVPFDRMPNYFFGHNSVTQPFVVSKTEKTPIKILKTPKMKFFTKNSWHIITNYDSPCMKMRGHYTILNCSKMSNLGTTVS